jgi:hypothetical protein
MYCVLCLSEQDPKHLERDHCACRHLELTYEANPVGSVKPQRPLQRLQRSNDSKAGTAVYNVQIKDYQESHDTLTLSLYRRF